MGKRRISVIQRGSIRLGILEHEVIMWANKRNNLGQYIIDNYDINFLISQINDQIFTILENTFKSCPIKIK